MQAEGDLHRTGCSGQILFIHISIRHADRIIFRFLPFSSFNLNGRNSKNPDPPASTPAGEGKPSGGGVPWPPPGSMNRSLSPHRTPQPHRLVRPATAPGRDAYSWGPHELPLPPRPERTSLSAHALYGKRILLPLAHRRASGRLSLNYIRRSSRSWGTCSRPRCGP